MLDTLSEYLTLGSTQLCSFFFTIDKSIDHYHDALDLLGAQITDPEDWSARRLPSNATAQRERIASMSDDELTPYILSICVVNHEMRHVRQATNTTAGLSRILIAYERNAHLSGYLHDTAHNVLLPFAQYGHPACSTAYPAEHECAQRLLRLTWMLAAFDGFVDTTIGTHQELWNEAARTVNASSLDNIRVPPLDCIDPHGDISPDGLNVDHLLEGECRLEDVTCLGPWLHAGASPRLIASLLNNFLSTPGYCEAWNYFNANLSHKNWADQQSLDAYRIALWLALFSDLHVMGNILPSEECVIWEDYQPCWRFVRIIEWLSNHKIPCNPLDEIETLSDSITTALGWRSPFSVARQCLQHLSTDRLNDDHSIGFIWGTDVYDRFRCNCEMLAAGRFEPSLSELTRFIPWFRGKGDLVWSQNLPLGLPAGDGLAVVMFLSILDSVFGDASLEASREFLRCAFRGIDAHHVDEQEFEGAFREHLLRATNRSLSQFAAWPK